MILWNLYNVGYDLTLLSNVWYNMYRIKKGMVNKMNFTKFNEKTASNLLSAAHSITAAQKCKSWTVAFICYKMAFHWWGA